ncbi:DUF6223 family protein [Streptomyces hirsutus]|uniref:DUF6223 family protein n=1 Tax=Streptomyces hirsutus TaxID=35620 RepID=UPI00341F129F
MLGDVCDVGIPHRFPSPGGPKISSSGRPGHHENRGHSFGLILVGMLDHCAVVRPRKTPVDGQMFPTTPDSAEQRRRRLLRTGALVAMTVGLTGIVLAGVALVIADGGPGTGNGVVGSVLPSR